VVFAKGSFYSAARASVAIPAIFTPVKHEDTILVDGGVLNPSSNKTRTFAIRKTCWL